MCTPTYPLLKRRLPCERYKKTGEADEVGLLGGGDDGLVCIEVHAVVLQRGPQYGLIS